MTAMDAMINSSSSTVAAVAAKHESMRVLWDIAKEYETLDARRDEAMRKAKTDGASYEDIALPFGLSKGAIRLWFIKWREQGKC